MNLRLLDSNLLIINGFLFVSACMLTIGGLSALTGAVKSASNVSVQSTSSLPIVKIDSTPLSTSAVTGIATRLSKTYPGVSAVVVNGEKIKISISDPSAYSRWQAAIGDLLLTGDKNTIFETVSICGTNCSGEYCVAEFRPRQVRYSMIKP